MMQNPISTLASIISAKSGAEVFIASALLKISLLISTPVPPPVYELKDVPPGVVNTDVVDAVSGVTASNSAN